MNIFQIQNIRNKQTVNANRWTLEFIGLDDMLKKAATSTKPWIRERYLAVKNAIGVEGQLAINLQLSLVSTTTPPVKLEIQNLTRFNDQVKTVTKFAEMEQLQVVFYDYVDGSASAIMQLWHAFVGDKKTGAIGFKEDFVLPRAFFKVYGPDAPGYDVASNGTPTQFQVAEIPWLQKYEIWNLFPTEVQLGAHGENAETRKITVPFVCDNFFPVGIRNYKSGAYDTDPELSADYIALAAASETQSG